jgi:hypothetical protein
MNTGDWDEVKRLSERMSTLKNKLERNRSLLSLGEKIYETPDIVPDPFSPGLQNLSGTSPEGLPGLRDKVLKRLETFERDDSSAAGFYNKRKKAFKAITIQISGGKGLGIGSMTEAQLHSEALQALNKGDMELLEQVADSLMKKTSKTKTADQTASSAGQPDFEKPDRLFSFTKETLAKAEKLGFAAARADAEREHALICHRHAWHPFIGEEIETHPGATQVSGIPINEAIPETLKQRMGLYTLHPFINSGGARHLPDMVAEDCLVEDFPDPEEAVETAVTGLLDCLGLKKRRGLSRIKIEKALFEHETDVINNELGLEIKDFRLVCIPADLHLRLGLSRGWGQQKIWTHFDGYMILKGGKLMALAGGDVRFGGVYDLVSIGREYVSDHVMARFAVVQRKRTEAW